LRRFRATPPSAASASAPGDGVTRDLVGSVVVEAPEACDESVPVASATATGCPQQVLPQQVLPQQAPAFARARRCDTSEAWEAVAGVPRGCEKPGANRRRRRRDDEMADKLLGGGRAVFRIRDYSLYCGSRFLWGIGQHVQTISIAWLVYELTHDPLKLGLIGLTAFVPAVPLALVAGPAADRYDRRTIIILCSAAMALTSITVLLMLLGGFIHAGRTWPLYGAVLVFGAARAFSGPAGQALVMSLVPKEQFTSAAAWNNTVNQSATILGPSIGGLLIPFGSVVPFAVAFAALSASALLASLIHARMAKGGKPPVTFDMLVAGYRFIWKSPVILGSITLDLIAVMLAGVTALLPVFARDMRGLG